MLYYAQGNAIVSDDELLYKPTRTKVTRFYEALSVGKTPSPIMFSTGELTLDNVIKAIDTGTKAPVPFQPIGEGRPLTIMIREIYTGQHPSGGLFGKKKDLLVTSAVKSITTFDAKPRAINFLSDSVSPKSRLSRPAATKQGTPIIFYSPALVEKSLTLDLSLVFDRFPKEVFNTVGDTFQQAGGIPIFLSYSVYLLAAGAIAKIVGAAGEALFDGKPVFSASEPLNIYWPGEQPLQSGFILVTDGNVDNTDASFRKTYQVNSAGQVVDESGKPYVGDIPYIVISLDGTSQDELSSFTPTAASSAMLSRFFGMKDNQPQLLGSLIDAVKLYNDFTFRQQVDRLDKQIEELPDGKEKEALSKKREALAKNILTDLLRK
jgi:hypothetical protein